MRKRKGNRLPMIGLCLVTMAIATGCTRSWGEIVRAMEPTVRAHPQLQEKLVSIKTVAIMPPGVTVERLGAWLALSGIPRAVMEEETAAARRTLATAIEQELGRHAGVVFTPFPALSAGLDASRDPMASRLTAELEDTQALFETVNTSIILHTTYKYRYFRFVEKLTNFDYSLGPDVQQFAKLANTDALLFTAGIDLRLSGGEKTLRVLANLPLYFLELLGGGSSGGGGLPLVGPTTLSVALVDASTGTLLWYNVVGDPSSSGGHSLTNPYSVTNLIAQLLEDFPLGTRLPRNEYDGGAWSSTPGPH